LSAPVATYPDLRGKVALLTGGSKGIGAATCRALAANGVRVAVNGRSREALDELVAELGASTAAFQGDCRDEGGLAALRRSVEEELGPVELLAAFAGGFEAFTPVAEMSAAEWREVVDANLTSTFLTVREFLPAMIERRRGAIVTMSSISGRYLDKTTQAAYAAAKAGVLMFTRHLALEVGRYGVRANAVAPGTTMSERIARVMDDEAIVRTTALAPLGRLGEPADTANAAVFLLSDAAAWLTGVTIDVTGGRAML
jgi:3-oxoacyl-[acyl-carrier protein] reductase